MKTVSSGEPSHLFEHLRKAVAAGETIVLETEGAGCKTLLTERQAAGSLRGGASS